MVRVVALVAAFTSSAAAAAPLPVTPDPSPQAASLLAYLWSLKGSKMLTGQHTYSATDFWYDEVKAITGKHPAVWGADFGCYDYHLGTHAQQRRKVVDDAIRHHKSGAIVTLTWHHEKPGSTPSFQNSRAETWPGEDWEKYVTPGTPQHTELLKDWDEAAAYLKELRAAGVPVLWRPYHEQNGAWFWWGGNAGRMQKLWKLMFERYAHHHKLANLIWNWNVNSNYGPVPFEGYFPGHEFVDMLSVDVYDGFLDADYASLAGLAKGKPLGLGETGPFPDFGRMQKSWPDMVYFMTWGNCLYEACHQSTPYHGKDRVKEVYLLPYLLTLDEVPNPLPVTTRIRPRPGRGSAYLHAARLPWINVPGGVADPAGRTAPDR